MNNSPFGAFPAQVDENIKDAGGIEDVYGAEIATNFIIQQFFHKCAMEMDVGSSVGLMIRVLSRSLAHIAFNLRENNFGGGDIDKITDDLLDVLENSMEISLQEIEVAGKVMHTLRKQ